MTTDLRKMCSFKSMHLLHSSAGFFFLQIWLAGKNFRLIFGLAEFLRCEQKLTKFELKQVDFCKTRLA